MRKYLLPLGAAAVAAVAFIALVAVPIEATGSTGQRHVVEIRQLEFHPQELVVAPGDTVVWINRDLVPHTASADDATWDSETIDAKQEWQIIVSEGMGETYLCLHHPTMKGRLRIAQP